jgi:hypothetical protein
MTTNLESRDAAYLASTIVNKTPIDPLKLSPPLTRTLLETTPEEPKPRFVIHRAAEAMQPQPPLEPIVDGIALPGSVIVAYGPPGSKKTYTCLDLAVCVAMGADWLGHATRQGTVLFCDEESGERRFNRRLAGIMRARGAPDETPVAYTTLAGLNLRDDVDLGELERLIGQVQPLLVILDALADVLPGADENTVRDTHPPFRALRGIAEKYQIAIIVIHHANKVGGYRGSSAIEGAVDLMLEVKSDKGASIIELASTKTRDTEPFDFAAEIAFDTINGLVTLTEAEPPSQTPQFGKPDTYVLKYLMAHGRSSLANIEDHADICSPASAKQSVYRLTSREIIKRVDAGGRGTSAEYDLTLTGWDYVKKL